jgi:phosphotransferase system HPr (HPr) family protein
MSGETLRQSIIIANPQGFHMRPIVAFVEAAGRFRSEVRLSKVGEEPVNGKGPLALLGLAAEQGTELILEVTGPDAAEALPVLLEVLQRTDTEDE